MNNQIQFEQIMYLCEYINSKMQKNQQQTREQRNAHTFRNGMLLMHAINQRMRVCMCVHGTEG